MTITEAKDYVKNLLFEDAATTALFTDAQLSARIKDADRVVWSRVLTRSPSMCVPANTEVAATFSNGLATIDLSTNLLRGAIHRVQVKRGTEWVDLDRISSREAEFFTDSETTSYGNVDVGWYVVGNIMYLIAASDGTVQVKTWLMEHVVGATDNDLVLLSLGEWAIPYSEVVPLEAAKRFAIKDENWDMVREIRGLLKELYTEMDRVILKAGSTRASPGIIEVPFN
jgi:hypothetical protein